MGILLAAEIVERIAGMALAEFGRKEIFEPLGMKRSPGAGPAADQ
jgi:CubicO group peptidase (beta-lactamase class C family)